MSNIKTRLLNHFAQGRTLSVRTAYKVRISNVSREIIRNFEDIHNIPLERRKIIWVKGWYFEYYLSPENQRKADEIRKQLINKKHENI